MLKQEYKKSLFLEFIGDYPTTRVLDYLLTNRELDFSITDIADNSNIGRATFYKIIKNMRKNKIIIYTRNIGKSRLFKLNLENPKIKKLAELYDMIVLEELKKK